MQVVSRQIKKSRALESKELISVVIPCYNEAEVLPMLFERLSTVATTWSCDFEVICVDDGSSDATWEILKEYSEEDPRWKVVKLARNFGHQVALWTGLKYTSGRIVAVLDADLQDPPELIEDFIEHWKNGCDVVYGVRKKRKEGWLKKTAYFTYYRLLSLLSNIEIPLDSGDFCLMDRKVVNAMLTATEQEPFIRGLRAWVGFRQFALPYERDARAAGDAKYNLVKLMRLALNGILSFSAQPLRLATYMGLIVSGLSFLGALFTLAQRIFADQFAKMGLAPVPGFATIVIAILFLGGIQLICLGILGEYVGRIYNNMRGLPQSVVSEIQGFETQESVCQKQSVCQKTIRMGVPK